MHSDGHTFYKLINLVQTARGYSQLYLAMPNETIPCSYGARAVSQAWNQLICLQWA